jgi:cobalt/nickel transport system ATP-binding protein
MTAPAVEIKGLRYTYPDGTPALDGVDLVIDDGARFGILGANGAGKSTLLMHLNGILDGDGGVKVFGEAVTAATARNLRSRVALVFQDPDDMLFMPRLEDDVAFGPRNMGLPEGEVNERVAEALGVTGLAGLGGRAPHHMSLGERRRASIAAALAMKPELLALDEPTANLDGRGRRELAALLSSLGGTLVVASHDVAFVRGLCGEVAVLAGGRVAAAGPAAEVLASPAVLEGFGLA